jgi:hypothetical protein
MVMELVENVYKVFRYVSLISSSIWNVNAVKPGYIYSISMRKQNILIMQLLQNDRYLPCLQRCLRFLLWSNKQHLCIQSRPWPCSSYIGAALLLVKSLHIKISWIRFTTTCNCLYSFLYALWVVLCYHLGCQSVCLSIRL